MSILIKGMEMPKSCAKCKLFGEYGCPFIGAVGYALTEERRNDDCPLIPVPPHGDLIDRREIKQELAELLSKMTPPIMWPDWNDAVIAICTAPTIIPADPAEEGGANDE